MLLYYWPIKYRLKCRMAKYFTIFNSMTNENININLEDFNKYSNLFVDDPVEKKDNTDPIQITENPESDNTVITLNRNIRFSCLELVLEYINMHKYCIDEERILVDKPLQSKVIDKIYKNKLDVQFFTKVSDHNNVVQLLLLSKMLKMNTLINKTAALFAMSLKRSYKFKDQKNNEAVILINDLNKCLELENPTEFENRK